MGSDAINDFLRAYLLNTKRHRTIDALENEWKEESKKIRKELSFNVIKAPKRKTTEDFGKVRKRKRGQKSEEEKKIKIPKDFRELARTVGLPEGHLEFFYKNREKFHWEIKADRKIYCSKLGRKTGTCNFSTDISPNCLTEHMISEHGHEEFTCDEKDCKYVAFSKTTMTRHRAQFHTKFLPKTNYHYECKFDSCSFTTNSKEGLKEHEGVHENRLHRCEFCTYTTGYRRNLHDHIQSHFRVRGFECDLCSSHKAFYTKRALDLHKKIHAKDFTCSHCFQSHKTLSYLNKHVKICEKRLKRPEKDTPA